MSVSEMQKFYKDQTVFITGGTGVVGKILIRKLLMSCCDVKKIYLLIRGKKGKSAEERVDILLDSYFFQSLSQGKAELRRKVGVLSGDCCLPNLGLNPGDHKMLQDEATCIIHISASVRFDEELRIATYTNVRSVQSILEIAKGAKNLKVLSYVSTAYSNCIEQREVEEKFYDPPMTVGQLFKILDAMDDEMLNTKLSQILGKWPNTYTFTKAIAENVIREEGQNLPIGIIRPGIIVGSVNDPEPGWTDFFQGMEMICMGVYTGVCHCLPIRREAPVSLVPLDYAVNHILSVSWDIGRNRKPLEESIYNFVGSKTNKISGGEFADIGIRNCEMWPSSLSVWKPFVISTVDERLLKIYQDLFHNIPAHVVDFVLLRLGKKPRMVKLMNRVNKGSQLIAHFIMHSWIFKQTHTEKLWEKCNKQDKELFPFNMDHLDWTNFCQNLLLSGRCHLLKDPLHNLPKAKKRRVFLEVLHYSTIIILMYLFYIMISFILNILFKFI
ncbi:fatty acyl-CoA reductase wat-like [Tenebrio molitor]|uniref:fatty acyl-CoA reductase wat-like n=1 Tax=Tenebrio molitor TaxID=7067 RepID=UPI00362481A8